MPITTIPLDTAVRDRLKKYGTIGMTYSDVIKELLDKIERDKFLDEIRHIADTNKSWTRLEDL